MTRAMLSTLLLAGLALAFAPPHEATFSDPTAITNVYVPFTPESVNVRTGRSDGAQAVTVDTHLTRTRRFVWRGRLVEARIIEEQGFEDGQLVEITEHYLAQADDGTVYYFGEVSREIEDGEDVGVEDDAWLVGGPVLPSDSAEVRAVRDPTVYMPADPQVGDIFKQEDFPGLDETLTVVAVERSHRVPAGTFADTLRLMETDALDPEAAPEYRWVAAGIGLIRERGRGKREVLAATALVPDEVPEPR